jgi:hypothetical protein
MTHRGMEISRFNGIPTPDMNGIKGLTEPNEVLKVCVRAGPSARVSVSGVRGAGNGAERDGIAANIHIAQGVAGVERELARGKANRLFDQPAIKSYSLGIGFDLRSSRLQKAPRFGVQKIDANFFQNRQGGDMDGLKFVVTNC